MTAAGTGPHPDRRRLALGLTAALLVGLNLRPAITSVAALLDVIAAQQLPGWEVVVLSSLPIASFGIAAPFIPAVARRLGVEAALLWAMVALCIALWLRAQFEALLLPGTLVASVAIMFGSVLVPPFLRSLAATPFWVGVTTTTFGLGAALGAWFAIPLHDLTRDLPLALGVWAIPALLAVAGMLVVVLASRGVRRDSGPNPIETRPAAPTPRRLGNAVVIVVAFSLMTMVYSTVIAWLPVILQAQGISPGTAGTLLALFNVAGFVPTMLLGVIAARRRVLIVTTFVSGMLIAVAMAGLALGVSALAWIFVVIVGLAETAMFGISMLLLVRNARPGSSALSATSQGIGYVFGALVSAGVGVLHALTGTWAISLWILTGTSVLLALFATIAVRTSPRDDLQATDR